MISRGAAAPQNQCAFGGRVTERDHRTYRDSVVARSQGKRSLFDEGPAGVSARAAGKRQETRPSFGKTGRTIDGAVYREGVLKHADRWSGSRQNDLVAAGYTPGLSARRVAEFPCSRRPVRAQGQSRGGQNVDCAEVYCITRRWTGGDSTQPVSYRGPELCVT